MKKQLLLSSLAMISLSGAIIAQPTLTATGINPVVGDVFTLNNGNYTSPGNSGANQTWDLTAIGTGTPQSENLVSPSSTPNGASFTGANVTATDGSNYYLYYTASSSAWQNKGFDYPSAPATVPYSDPEDLLHFPFAYTNSYTDNFSSVYQLSGYTFYRTGTVTVTADGYGTIITPAGTYGNVMRVHFQESYQDSVDFGGFPNVSTYQNDEYMWYLNGNHTPIALVYTANSSSSGTSTVGQYLSNVVGIKENVDNSDLFTTFPSPASTQLTIDTKGSTTFENAEITSASGSKVMAVELTNNFGSSTIDVSNLASGVYFIELKNKEGVTARRKFVVTH